MNHVFKRARTEEMYTYLIWCDNDKAGAFIVSKERTIQAAITIVDICFFRLLDAMALSLQEQKQTAVEYVTGTARVVQGVVTKATDQNQAIDPNRAKSRNPPNQQQPAVN